MLTLRAKMTVAMIALVVATAISVEWLANRAFDAEGLPETLDGLGGDTRLLAGVLQAAAIGAGADVLVFARLEAAAAVAGGADAADTQLADLFTSALAVKRRYLQLRFLDTAGNEVLRVERRDGRVRSVPPEELQDKSDRPYVEGVLSMQPGELYVSSVELNQEEGALDVPHVPVVRLATPIASESGVVGGFIILNMDMRTIFTTLKRDAMEAGRELYIMSEHQYLLHPDHGREFEWSRGLGAGWSEDFASLPEEWRSDPAWTGLADIDGESVGVATRRIPLAGGPPVVVLMTEPEAQLMAGQRRLVTSAVLGGALVALMATVLAALLARSLSRPMARLAGAVARFEEDDVWDPPTGVTGEAGVLTHTLDRAIRSEREKHGELEREIEIRRRTEEALEREAARLRWLSTVSQSSLDGIYTMTVDGIVTSWNPGAERLYGHTADEIVGQHVSVLVREEDRPEVARVLDRLRAGEAVRDYETVRITRDGDEVDVSLTLSPVRDDSGEVIGTSAIARDIGEHKALEEELRRSNEDLEQFAYVASHDLQEPLRMVASYTELLGQRYGGQLDDRADKYIRYAVDGAKRMQLLITDLLRFSRIESESQPFTRTDLNTVVCEVLQSRLSAAVTEAAGTVTVDALPVVQADHVQMSQVFQNLISNALKFRHAERPPEVCVAAERRGPMWVISVQDNGVGIEEEYAERIFEMFQRLHGVGAYPGSGIGLTLTRKIVRRHGGSIWFESTPGSGTTFYFTLAADER